MRWLCLAVLLAAAPVHAQTQCDARKSVLDQLMENYGEAVIGTGISSAGTLVEFLVSPDGSTWTVISTFPNGMTCIAGSGKDWQPIERKPVEPKGQPS